MEPTDLNSSPDANDEARLTALLRPTSAPLPDDGFSARVVMALPPAGTGPAPWRRIVFCLAGLAAGCGVVLWRGGSWITMQSGADRFVAAFGREATPNLASPWLVSALVVATLSLVFAFRVELRDRFL
jgi:hypothetical protein